jgi:hypothetical protein
MSILGALLSAFVGVPFGTCLGVLPDVPLDAVFDAFRVVPLDADRAFRAAGCI